MNIDRKVVEQALNALETLDCGDTYKTHNAATAIRQALAEQPAQQEPVAWIGLTNNELQPIADEYHILFGSWVEDFARAIEAKLKEKNT